MDRGIQCRIEYGEGGVPVDRKTRPGSASTYVDPVPRQQRSEEIDSLVAEWVGRHSFDEAMKVFLAEGWRPPPSTTPATCWPTSTSAPAAFVAVDDPQLGSITVQSPVALLSAPGAIEHLGRELGADNYAVYGGLLGMDAVRIDALQAAGTI